VDDVIIGTGRGGDMPKQIYADFEKMIETYISEYIRVL